MKVDSALTVLLAAFTVSLVLVIVIASVNKPEETQVTKTASVYCPFPGTFDIVREANSDIITINCVNSN